MNLITIAGKSVRQRALASSLTALSVALGVMLMVAVLVIYGVVDRMFNQSATGYDLIVGPKGSKLQLVLNSIYRISQPIENLPYRFYRELQDDSRIAAAIPMALGDVTQQGAFPILGTVPEYFTTEFIPGKTLDGCEGGRPMQHAFDAVIGSVVAQNNGWDVGSKLHITHGGVGGHTHDEPFTVVSVLKPTGTPNDKTVFVHLDGFYALEGHEKPIGEALNRLAEFYPDDDELQHDVAAFKATGQLPDTAHSLDAPDAGTASTVHTGGDHEMSEAEHAEHADHEATHGEREAHDDHSAHEKPESRADDDAADSDPDHHDGDGHHHEVPDVAKEVTAILIKMKGDSVGDRVFRAMTLSNELNEGVKAQAVNPIAEIRRLMDNIVGNIRTLILVLTALIIAVSGVGIFVSIYNSMADRKREIAVMRALGARRQTVFSIILAESTILCFGGGVLGMLMGHALVYIASPIIEARSGFLLDPFAFEPAELILIPALVLLASLIGFVPGLTAYRTDVAKALSD